jgi:HlyD family secretion protein
MKKIILILIFFFSAIFWGCGHNNNKNKIEASGDIEATNVTVSSKVNGQVLKIYFDEGALVKEGDTLLTIDHDLLSIQLQQAEAAIESAQAQYDLLKEGARSEDVKQASDALKQAAANFELAKLDYERNERLYKSNSITKQQFDTFCAKYDIAKAQLNSAKENLKKMKNLARPEELKQAKANLDRQIASANLIKKNISDSYVVAPISGFVVKKYIEVGENVLPMSSLMMLTDLSYVDLMVYVPETQLGKVQLGQNADVTVDSYKNKIFKGKVIYISPQAEFTPKNIQTQDERTKLVYAVKIHIANPKYELKDGMPADAVIFTN